MRSFAMLNFIPKNMKLSKTKNMIYFFLLFLIPSLPKQSHGIETNIKIVEIPLTYRDSVHYYAKKYAPDNVDPYICVAQAFAEQGYNNCPKGYRIFNIVDNTNKNIVYDNLEKRYRAYKRYDKIDSAFIDYYNLVNRKYFIYNDTYKNINNLKKYATNDNYVKLVRNIYKRELSYKDSIVKTMTLEIKIKK